MLKIHSIMIPMSCPCPRSSTASMSACSLCALPSQLGVLASWLCLPGWPQLGRHRSPSGVSDTLLLVAL